MEIDNQSNSWNDSDCEMDFYLTETINVETTYTSDNDQSTHIYKPIEPVRVNTETNRVHLVVDFLNLVGEITRSQEDLGFMNLEKRVLDHQLGSKIEVVRIMENIKVFFDSALPVGSKVLLVTKRFGDKQIWNCFKQSFREILVNPFEPCNQEYELYVAQKSQRFDKEHDDRLTVRLALMLKSEGKRVFVVSNDKYRSMATHWDLDSSFVKITDDAPTLGQKKIFAISADHFGLDLLRDLHAVKFGFSCNQSTQVQINFLPSTISVM
ncbi:hypothetical protein qu_158 [Acanthamoeba polyphaga mimivirus]|nr:hypothetical protein [Mimivirus reunion]WMV61496.1 hypothetical protein qu_158 [Mimivirus sp.]WMV62473.1 hypothetical protein qu_158 [Acanthamoeba polyphaga mimivirus]WMV63450.1 hypothetical protein qu_158 [Mimivirus sp.]